MKSLKNNILLWALLLLTMASPVLGMGRGPSRSWKLDNSSKAKLTKKAAESSQSAAGDSRKSFDQFIEDLKKEHFWQKKNPTYEEKHDELWWREMFKKQDEYNRKYYGSPQKEQDHRFDRQKRWDQQGRKGDYPEDEVIAPDHCKYCRRKYLGLLDLPDN